jgi:cysteinyl-tRNA synthetase
LFDELLLKSSTYKLKVHLIKNFTFFKDSIIEEATESNRSMMNFSARITEIDEFGKISVLFDM